MKQSLHYGSGEPHGKPSLRPVGPAGWACPPGYRFSEDSREGGLPRYEKDKTKTQSPNAGHGYEGVKPRPV